IEPPGVRSGDKADGRAFRQSEHATHDPLLSKWVELEIRDRRGLLRAGDGGRSRDAARSGDRATKPSRSAACWNAPLISLAGDFEREVPPDERGVDRRVRVDREAARGLR